MWMSVLEYHPRLQSRDQCIRTVEIHPVFFTPPFKIPHKHLHLNRFHYSETLERRLPCLANLETRSLYSSEVSSCQSDPNPSEDLNLSVLRPNDLDRSALMLETALRPLASILSQISFLQIRISQVRMHRRLDSFIRSATLAISFAASSNDGKSKCDAGVTFNNSDISRDLTWFTLKQ